jgi:hypothetical protein
MGPAEFTSLVAGRLKRDLRMCNVIHAASGFDLWRTVLDRVVKREGP